MNQGVMSRLRLLMAFCGIVAVSSCALVPKESVELSTTVGRDVAVVHASHRVLAQTLFGRMRGDVNRFVDDVYAPYQIQFALTRQKEKHNAGKPDNLFSVLETAMKEPQNSQAQKDVLPIMQAIVELIHEDVEDYRKIRLAPIDQQETAVLANIDLIYAQIERGNAEVTAHLASVVKVHEAQDEVLKAADLAGLREKIGVKLSDASEKVASFVDSAEKVDGTLDEAKENVDKLAKQLDALTKGEQ